ncbi:MAG: hypothetical protein EBX40_05540 [Gammaproteobacteria bacterium]|nr:hypothetical protein [Gammaproteobacteria bacterium]
MEITIKIKYRIGDIVFSRSDPEEKVRFVTGYLVRKNLITYVVSYEGMESYFYDFELIGDNERLIGSN